MAVPLPLRMPSFYRALVTRAGGWVPPRVELANGALEEFDAPSVRRAR
jgi:hypothetical protein